MSIMPRRKKTTYSLRDDYMDLLRKRAEVENRLSAHRLWQKRVFSFLERPNSKISFAYHVLSFSIIFGSMVLSVLSTVEDIHASRKFSNFILYFEVGLLSWFILEYISRVWSCSTVSKYKGCLGRLRFAKTFYMLLDFFVILSTLTTTILQIKRSYFTMLRISRFFQVFRILRFDRQRGALATMGRVVFKHRKELLTCYFVGFIILFSGTYIVYIVEKSAADANIDNMVNGIYWAMITVTSVGYGDRSPVTWGGKIVSGVFALIGCAFFSLPAGILGSGFALQVARQKKDKSYTKLRNPAAVVIQTLWRNHSLKESSELQGTWNHFFPQIVRSKIWSKYYAALPGIQPLRESESEVNFMGVKINLKNLKKKSRNIFPLQSGSKTSALKESSMKIYESEYRSGTQMFANRKISLENSEMVKNRCKVAVRFIMRVRYWTSIQYFRRCRQPFVNMHDVMEKTSKNHSLMTSNTKSQTLMLSHMKEMRRSLNVNMIEMHECIDEIKTELIQLRVAINCRAREANGLLHLTTLSSENCTEEDELQLTLDEISNIRSSDV